MVQHPKFQLIYKYLCVTIVALIALGGSVRAMNAGLACPDWPLCFGDIIPDYHPQVYFEFLHRVLAGLVALVVVALNGIILKSKAISKTTKALCWLSFVILATQIVLGGLTVLWDLHAKIVTLHLALGTGLYGCMQWIYFAIRRETGATEAVEVSKGLGFWLRLTLLVVYGQILLGGLVASHYAALVCTEFPLCHGKFIPTFEGIIGLQVIHRLGAYVTFGVVTAGFFWTRKHMSPVLAKYGRWLFLLVLVQMALGIANILLLTPPLITVLHLTVATLMLGVSLALNHKIKVPATQAATLKSATQSWV